MYLLLVIRLLLFVAQYSNTHKKDKIKQIEIEEEKKMLQWSYMALPLD